MTKFGPRSEQGKCVFSACVCLCFMYVAWHLQHKRNVSGECKCKRLE